MQPLLLCADIILQIILPLYLEIVISLTLSSEGSILTIEWLLDVWLLLLLIC